MNFGELIKKQLETSHRNVVSYDSIIKNTIVEYYFEQKKMDISRDIIQSHYKNDRIFILLKRKILSEELKNHEFQIIKKIMLKLQKINPKITISHLIIK